MDDPGKQTPFREGDPRIYRLGYFWWEWNGYAGELQYIRFPQQIFFPPNHLVNGWGWNVETGVRGRMWPTYTKLNELPVEVIGQALNLAAGKIGGMGKITNTGITTVPSQMIKMGTNQRLKGYISNR